VYTNFCVKDSVRVFKATYNNISIISRRSVSLVEETVVPRENDQHVASHWQTLSHNVVTSTLRHYRNTAIHDRSFSCLGTSTSKNSKFGIFRKRLQYHWFNSWKKHFLNNVLLYNVWCQTIIVSFMYWIGLETN
jgi:hypothetical protein